MAYDMPYLSRRDICSAMRSMRPDLRWINEADVNVILMRLSPSDVDDVYTRSRVLFTSQHHGVILTKAMLHRVQQLQKARRKGYDNPETWQGQGAGGPNAGLRSVEEFQSIEQTEHQDNLRRLSLIGFPTQSRQLGANPPHLIAGGAYHQRGSYTFAFTSANKMRWWFRYYGCEQGSLARMLGPVIVPWYAEMEVSSMRKTNF